MSSATEVNAKLAAIFRNGHGEIGLEVGTDPGLPVGEWIQIPNRMRRDFALRLKDEAAKAYEPVDTDTCADLNGKPGWIYCPVDSYTIMVCKGNCVAKPKGGAKSDCKKVDKIFLDPLTLDDISAFIAVNTNHIRDDIFEAADQTWIHATRFWSVVSGFVVGTKSKEYVLVDDPTVDLAPYAGMAAQVADMRDNVLTACAARAASWRKSNHATGGEIAQGFPRRWLQKCGYWTNTGDRAAVRSAQVLATSAFYVATHASSVHNVLALLASSDEGHWAEIDPSYGLTMSWDVKTSTQVRIAPKTQVAGTAMVTDAVQVMKMLIGEGIFPFLQNHNQWRALMQLYRTVESGGVRCASYASWFLDGHPEGMKAQPFNQKDAACADLIGELAAVAKTYYRRSSIGESMSLENAMSQLASESVKDQWSALARQKGEVNASEILKAYTRIAGKGASAMIAAVNSDDEGTFVDAINAFNLATAEVAKDIGMSNPITLDADALAAQAGLTGNTPASI